MTVLLVSSVFSIMLPYSTLEDWLDVSNVEDIYVLPSSVVQALSEGHIS